MPRRPVALQRGVVVAATIAAAAFQAQPAQQAIAKAEKTPKTPKKRQATKAKQPREPKSAKAAAPASQERPDGVLAMTADERRQLRAADRENPLRLGGEALRELGHEWGLQRSEMAQRTDPQVRDDTRTLMRRKYDPLVAFGA